MHITVSTRPRSSAASTARDLRTFMRDEQVTAATLAWILRCSRGRAFKLRYWSTNWMLDEVVSLIDACAPASTAVPTWGGLARATA